MFTPDAELPFAGHPTIGTTWVMAVHGLAPTGAARFELEEQVGPVPVELEGNPSRPDFIWMKHPDATFDQAALEALQRQEVATAKADAACETQHITPVEAVVRPEYEATFRDANRALLTQVPKAGG